MKSGIPSDFGRLNALLYFFRDFLESK